jgi:NAD(P)-dependent dehydrogenase (short-subunit alcohol dehydrogenase family)
VVVADLVLDRAEQVAAEIDEQGQEAIAVMTDATRQDHLEAARDLCIAKFDRVDLIMNNVGVLALGRPEELPDEAWQRVFDVNVMSIARSNRVFLPAMIERRHGHVVNTASASGLLAYGFDRLPYVASKHATVGLSESLAIYLGPHGVGVTCLCPSGVMTNIVEQITAYGAVESKPKAPAHPVVEADVVGRLTADAVEAGQFLVTTTPEVPEELRERAGDIERYLAAKIRAQSA